jgi:hypothetical protein
MVDSEIEDFGLLVKRKHISFRRTYFFEKNEGQERLYIIKGTLQLRWSVFLIVFLSISSILTRNFFLPDHFFFPLVLIMGSILIIWILLALFHKIFYYNSFKVENTKGIRFGTIKGGLLRKTWRITNDSNQILIIKFGILPRGKFIVEIDEKIREFEFIADYGCFSLRNLKFILKEKNYENSVMIIKTQFFSKYLLNVKSFNEFDYFNNACFSLCFIEKIIINRSAGYF